jgi:hypothetical protein
MIPPRTPSIPGSSTGRGPPCGEGGVQVSGHSRTAVSSPKAREDLREAPQGPHETPVVCTTQVEELPESVPEELLALESGSHHGLYLDHGEAPLRPAELRVPAAPDACGIAWDLGQLSSDLSAITKEMTVATFASMALVVGAGHTLAPQSKRKLVIGGKLQVRPQVQAAWYKLMADVPEGTTAGLLKQLGALEIEGDTIVSGLPAKRPNWPRYSEGPTDAVRTFTASFKLVAEASKTPKEKWGPVYVSLLHGYAATIAISYLEDIPNTTYAALLGYMCDVLDKQHVAADKTALEVRVLGPTEDLGYFANSLQVLTRRAYGHMYKPPQVEERAGEAFVRGLTGTLKQRVREDFAENLDAVLKLACNLEAVGISCLDKVVAPVAPTASGPRPAVGAAWVPSRRPSHGSQGSQGTRPSDESSQRSGVQPKDDIICWFCSFKGHTKSECQKKAATDAAARHGHHQKTAKLPEATGLQSPSSACR